MSVVDYWVPTAPHAAIKCDTAKVQPSGWCGVCHARICCVHLSKLEKNHHEASPHAKFLIIVIAQPCTISLS